MKSLNEMEELHDSRVFKDAESVRSGQSHVTCQPTFFPPFQNPGENVKPFRENAEPQRWAAKYLGHAWYIGKRFCISNSVFFSTLSARDQILEY